MNRGSGRTGTPPGRSTDGGRNVRFEETLDLEDEGGASGLVTVVRVLVLFLIVTTLGSLVLVVVGAADAFLSAVGGVDVALSIVDDVRSERPLAVVGFLLVGLLSVGFVLFSIVGFLLQVRRAFDQRVHVRVTDAGVSVRREGSRYWQSSGVEIPFDAITAVERPDSDESSVRVELGDLRAPKFLAGRRRNWVRLERGDDPAVYVGSDRPVELAETIARRAPGVESSEPF